MVRNRATTREVPFGRDPTKPTGQAEMAENNLASYRTSAEVELSSLQTGWVKINSKNRSILVSRRTFSEIVRSQPPTIIYSYTTGVEGDKKIRGKVLVSFHPTTKTYKILIFQSPNSAITNSSTNLDPATKEGKDWIRCLRLAYSYFPTGQNPN